jgi:arabinofuranosyltransferase
MTRADEGLERVSTETRRRLVTVLVGAGLGIVYVLLAWHLWWVCDDAYISFRYAKNWVAGFGLRFNPAEVVPVEGYSNFLWVLVAAVFEWLGVDPGRFVPLVSLACGLLLIQRVNWSLRHRLSVDPAPAFWATLWLATFPPFALWASGGLETMPEALLLFLAFDRLVLRREPAVLSGAAAGLALSLIRTDGFAWVLLVAGVSAFHCLSKPEWRARRLALCLAIVAVLYGGYFAWRLGYYGALFPNPVYLKVGFGWGVLLRGLRYVGHTLFAHPSCFVALAASGLALRHWRRPSTLPILALAFAPWAYAVVVGGDWMPMGRFLVSSFPFFALLIGQAAQEWPEKQRSFRPAVALAVVVLSLLPAWNIQPTPRSFLQSLKFRYSTHGYLSDYGFLDRRRRVIATWKKIGLTLKRRSHAGDSLVFGAVGAIGYYSDLHVYDRFGLVSPKVVAQARREARAGLRSPGHDVKVSPTFFLDEHPTYLTLGIVRGSGLQRQVVSQARTWRLLGNGQAWKEYAPEIVVIDDRPVSEVSRVLLVLKALAPRRVGETGPPREMDVETAKAAWRTFFESAKELPNR